MKITYRVGLVGGLGWIAFDFISLSSRLCLGRWDLAELAVQGGWGGWPTGNGKKLSSSQAQLGQAQCLGAIHPIRPVVLHSEKCPDNGSAHLFVQLSGT